MSYGRFTLVMLRGNEMLKMLMGVCVAKMGLIWLGDVHLVQYVTDKVVLKDI